MCLHVGMNTTYVECFKFWNIFFLRRQIVLWSFILCCLVKLNYKCVCSIILCRKSHFTIEFKNFIYLYCLYYWWCKYYFYSFILGWIVFKLFLKFFDFSLMKLKAVWSEILQFILFRVIVENIISISENFQLNSFSIKFGIFSLKTRSKFNKV